MPTAPDPAATRSRSSRKLLFGGSLALVSMVIGAGVGELVVRSGKVSPVRQIIRGNHVRKIDGVSVWDPEPRRAHIDCAEQHPERKRILFFGNSITHGSSVQAELTFAWLLEDRLNAARPNPGFCVMNFAVPAFRFAQKYAMAKEAVTRYRPAIVFYQDWDLEWGGVGCAWVEHKGDYPVEYSMLGNDVYGTAGLHLRSDGFPGLFGVPDSLNRILFLHSYLYQYVTLAIGEKSGQNSWCQGTDTDTTMRLQGYQKIVDLSRSVGAKPAFYIAADLTYPLSEVHPQDVEYEKPEFDLGQKEGFPVFTMRSILSDQDNVAVRMDNWHYGVKGHAVLAERFEKIAENILDGLPATANVLPAKAGPK